MTTQTLTLEIGEPLYQRLQERALRAHRTVEAEALDLVAQGVLDLDQLEPELAAAISELRFLDDTALWQAARMHMTLADAERLEVLHLKRQYDGLAVDEAEEARGLTGTYERIMVIRAEAAALLKERGYDVEVLRSESSHV
jgi:hypothetical protein